MTKYFDNVCLFSLNTQRDDRGALTAIEGSEDIPFSIRRIFYMHHITRERGGHAHIDTDQVVIAIHGSFRIRISNGTEFKEFIMNNPEQGLFLPRLTFTEFFNISEDAVCLVLANTHYDMSRSLRTYDSFIDFLNKNKDEKQYTD